jgi:hypothetical protein
VDEAVGRVLSSERGRSSQGGWNPTIVDLFLTKSLIQDLPFEGHWSSIAHAYVIRAALKANDDLAEGVLSTGGCGKSEGVGEAHLFERE